MNIFLSICIGLAVITLAITYQSTSRYDKCITNISDHHITILSRQLNANHNTNKGKIYTIQNKAFEIINYICTKHPNDLDKYLNIILTKIDDQQQNKWVDQCYSFLYHYADVDCLIRKISR